MERPEYTTSAESQAVNSKLDYRALMNFLTAGDLNSAKILCQLYYCRPALAQLLLGCGRLTVGDLDDLILVHETNGLDNLPLGKFFVYSGCLTAEELHHYVLLQKSLRLSPQHTERWGQKLVMSGLLSDEQLHQALSDRIICDITLRQAILDRGWLSEAQLDKIF
jgi:hypothetical protein